MKRLFLLITIVLVSLIDTSHQDILANGNEYQPMNDAQYPKGKTEIK